MTPARPAPATIIAGVIALLVQTASPPSFAEERPERVSIDVQAPKDCPTGADLERETERLLAAAKPTREPLEVRIVVVRADRRIFRLVLETGGERGSFRRELEAESCWELVKPAAVIIALAIDPEAVARGLEADAAARGLEAESGEAFAEPSKSRPAPARAASIALPERPILEPGFGVATAGQRSGPAEPARDSVSPSKPGRPKPFVPFLAGGVVDFGALPGPSLGPSIGGGVAWKSIRVQAQILYFPPRRAVLEEQPGKGGDIELTAGSVAGCFVPLDDPFEVGGCFGLEGGWVRGVGVGITDPGSGSTGWLATTGGAHLGYALEPELALVLQAAATARIGRSQFVIDGLGAVHEPSPYGARLALGAELRFP